MKHSDYLKKKKTRETRKKIISVISAIVVFITTYALVLPAITLDVSRASREPGIAYEQMQFKATASAASVTAADSAVEEAQVEEPAGEEAAEEEIIEEEAAEIPEEETSAVSDENEKEEAEQVVEEAPAESAREEAPAAEAEEVQEEEDKSAEEKADAEPSSEPAQEEAQTAETQKSADQAVVDQSGKSSTQATEAAAAASTEETAAEFQIPTLDPIDFDEILTGKTDFYFYHVEKTEEDENITSDSVDDWKKVGSDTVLAPEDFVRVYLSYEIPAGSLNETNAEARYRLPAGLELSDKQIKDINKYENGIAASKSGSEHDKYLGAEAIEGSRTPNEKAGDEYISATVKAEKVYKDGEYVGQNLIFTFIPYTFEKNQISYDEAGKLTSEGRNVKGFFTFDLTTAQIDFEKTEKETVEKEDGTTEETQYSKAEVVFVKENNKKNIDEISRVLTMAGPVEKEEPQAKAQKTLVSKGEDNDYTVTVSYTDDAQIPDNAELAVREIEKGSDEYASYLEQAKGAVDENKSVNEARFFDITIMADGEKVEPQAPVNVQINFNGIVQTNTDDTQLLHYKDDNEVEVMEKAEFSKSEESVDETKSVDTVQFEADGFSVYGIVGTETITVEHIDHKGTKYEVTVTYGPEAKIPEGSTLRVTDIEDGTKAYDDARNAVLADKKEKDEFVDIDDFNLAALDISIIDPNGQEIEPEAAVTVDIKIKDLPGVENLDEIKETLEIQHHVEVTDGVVVEKVFDGSVEGSYEMDTDKNIAKAGIVVDPSSVSDEDFRNVEVNEDNSLDTSFDTEVFSTFTITWRSGGRTVTVHYVDESGNELTIANPNDTHPNLNANSSSPAFLIYDIDGYEYSYTYRNNNTNANRIAPLLAKNSDNRWIYNVTRRTWNDGSFRDFTGTELSNGDNIYVVYKKKADPTTGGTPVIDDAQSSDWPQGSDTPQFSKSSTNNGNGTNTVSLSISGGEKDYEKQTKANVIVIMDVSGSMQRDMAGSTNQWGNYNTYGNNDSRQRLYIAKQAVNDMADTLLNDMDGVKMALVSFSTTTSTVQGFTDNYGTYTSAVNNLNPDGGTNWEQALSVANRMAVDSDAATFIVFVTDGDPTFRISRGDVTNNNLDMWSGSTYEYYRQNQVFGEGNNDSGGRNFDYAVDEVKSILSKNKTFYTIGVSNEVTKVQNLVNTAGGGSAYLATDSDALEEAFANITKSIKTTLGFGDVEVTDGITELSNVEMKMMHEVDPDSFTYYKITPSGQAVWDPASEGAGLASYDEETGAVKWDLGDGFQLEDGVTYMVTFRVWPSQDAYDLIADLNNGVKVYAAGQSNSITDEERGQIKELAKPTDTEQGRYTLKTNTDTVNATYSQTSSTGETVTVSGETGLTATYHEGTIEDMALLSDLLTIQKVFDQSLDPRTVESVTLKLQRKINDSDHEMADYNVPGTTSPNIVLGDFNDWKYSFYVAPGFIVDGETLETGYQFTVVEPDLGENTVRYDLIPEIVNPMVVDGTLQLIGDGDNNQALTAINRTRSAIEIHKTLYDIDGTTQIYPDTEFTITGQLLGPDGTPFTSQEVAAPVAYYLYDEEGNATTGRLHFADSSNISFTLKAGEFIRFVNVPEGCTFEFSETAIPDNYVLQSLAAVGRQRAEDDPAYTYSIELDDTVAHLVEGETTISTTDEGIIGNTNYKLDFYNRRVIPLPDVELVKVDQDDSTKKLNGASFELHKDSVDGVVVTTDGNGNAIDITTGNKEGSTGPDGWYHIGLLPAGTYYMIETDEPTGYVLDETPVIITVTKGTSSYSVTATKDGTNVLSGPTEGIYTITVDNVRATKYVKVFKYETGTNPEKALEGAQFSLTGPEGTGISYTGLTTNADGYLVYNNSTLLELAVNDSNYTLTETKAPDGYNMMTENVVFTVTSGGVTGTGSGYTVVSGTETVDGADVTVYTIKVQNSAGVELPHTGGPGTLPYTLGGIALIMASALMYGFRMRRRERRLN